MDTSYYKQEEVQPVAALLEYDFKNVRTLGIWAWEPTESGFSSKKISAADVFESEKKLPWADCRPYLKTDNDDVNELVDQCRAQPGKIQFKQGPFRLQFLKSSGRDREIPSQPLSTDFPHAPSIFQRAIPIYLAIKHGIDLENDIDFILGGSMLNFFASQATRAPSCGDRFFARKVGGAILCSRDHRYVDDLSNNGKQWS